MVATPSSGVGCGLLILDQDCVFENFWAGQTDPVNIKCSWTFVHKVNNAAAGTVHMSS